MNTLLSLSGTVLEIIPSAERFSLGIGPTLAIRARERKTRTFGDRDKWGRVKARARKQK